jgi:hypothetical protein
MIRLLICILGGGIQHDSSCLKQCENLDRELSYFWMKLDIRGIGFAMGDVAWTLLPRLNPGDFVFLSFGPCLGNAWHERLHQRYRENGSLTCQNIVVYNSITRYINSVK